MDQIPPASIPQNPSVPQTPPSISQQPTVNAQTPPVFFFNKYYFVILGILLFMLIGIPLLVYPKVLQNSRQLPLPTPTPSFTLENVKPAINSTNHTIQNTLATTQTNLAILNSLNLSDAMTATTSSKTAQSVAQKIITDITQESRTVDALTKELDPLVHTSSNFLPTNSAFIDLNNQLFHIQNTLKEDASLLHLLVPTNNNRQKILDTIRQDLNSIQMALQAIQNDLTKLQVQLLIRPTPPCIPRPACLDAHPACKITEPARGWCLTTPTPPNATSSAK